MAKIGLYIRLSNADREVKQGTKDESNSISSQRLLLHNFIKNNDEFKDSTIKEYFDDGVSGTYFEKRTGFKAVISDAQKGEIDTIIVKDLSRFGRDYLEVGYYLEFLLPLTNVRFISVTDNYDTLKLKGEIGGFEYTIKTLIHTMYVRDISKKIKSAAYARVSQGKYIGRTPVLGYKKDPNDKHTLVIVEDEAEIVKRIYKLYLSGKTTGDIAKLFNKYNFKNPRTNDYWLCGQIYTILHNEIYTGKLVQLKRTMVGFGDNKKQVKVDPENQVTFENAVPRIISDEDFNKIKTKRRTRATSKSKKPNFVYCGVCGKKLQRNSSYYCITGQNFEDCDCQRVKYKCSELEEYILKTVKEVALTALNTTENTSPDIQKELSKQLSKLKRKRDLINKDPTILYEEYKSGKITAEEFKEKRAKTEQDLQDIDNQISDIESKQNTQALPSVTIQILENCKVITTYDPELLSRIIEKVIVHPDKKIEVIFKGKDFIKENAKK